MKIKSIRLVNIKSYEDETINFSDGINCILGLNGSGKSSIIEAIGYGLFNFNRYTPNNKILRYNERKGSVEITFVGQDDRLYKVIRTQRSQSSTAMIIDAEGGNVLYEGIENVYAFIKKVLDISNTKDFSRMFEEIIAVPQGAYVSAFLTTSSERKENFDKLFDLHIYRNIANKLKDLLDFLKENYIIRLDKEIAEISARLLPYSERKKQRKALELDINNLDQKIIKESEAFEATKQKKITLEATKQKLEELKNQKALNEESQKHLKLFLEEKQSDLKISTEANEVLQKTKLSYLQHQDNAEKIKRLEKEYEALRVKELEAQNAQKNYEVLATNISNIKDQLQKLDIQSKENKQNYEETKSKGLFEKNEVITREEKYNKDLDILQQWREKGKNKTKALQTQEQNFRYFEAKSENLEAYEKDFLINVRTSISALTQQINDNEVIAKELEGLFRQQNYLEKDLQTALHNATLSIDGMCPFLNSKCKNIDEGSLEAYFHIQAEQIQKNIDEINEQIHIFEEKMIDSKQLIINRETKIKEQTEYIEKEKKIKAIKAEIVSQYSLDDEYLTYDLKGLLENVKEKNASLNQEVISIEEKISEYNKMVTEDGNLLSTRKYSLETLEQKSQELEKEQKSLLKEQDRLTGDLLSATRKQDELASKLKQISKVLVEGEEIKHDLDKLKFENVNLEEGKNLYIANEKRAKELTKIQREILSNEEDLQAKIKINSQIILDISAIQETFSNKILEEVGVNFNRLLEEISKLKATIYEKKINLADVNRLLKEMDELKEVKESLVIKRDLKNAQGEFINKMRRIYLDLPMRLSQTYREYISIAATNLYRQIAKENVRIELKEDYQVCLYDSTHPQVYKTIEQLSGGEQMSVAIAIRLSMLKHIAGVDIYFLDEPTINLDVQRREKVAEVISEAASNLSQLFVISHDDTFDEITQSIIKIEKTNNISRTVQE